MKYSIIVPALNEEHYIGRLLDSFVAQTYKDFEVIVVDGKSQDATCSVVESYMDRLDLRLIVSPERGPAFQRNFGGQKASADKLIFMDSDVFVDPDFLEMIDTYVTNNDPDIMSTWIKPDSNKLIDDLIFWVTFALYCRLVKFTRPATPGAFIYVKKEAFENVDGFSVDLLWAEDSDFGTRVYKSGYKKYKLLKEPRVHVSMRRLDKYGRLHFIMQSLKGGYLLHFKGGVTKRFRKIFSYEFGKFN